MSDEEPKIIHSLLSGKFMRDGIAVDVQIYRSEQEAEWMLEVVDDQWASTVWDEVFPTDQAAHDKFVSDVEREGLAGVIAGGQTPRLN